MRRVPPLALAFVVLLGGCIPIPPHHSPISRRNVPEEIPGWLQPERTTMADTLFRIGEPDDHSPNGRTLGWVNIDRLGGGILVFAAGGGGAVAGAMGERYRRLVVIFDGNGMVMNRSLESAACISGMWCVDHAGAEFGGHCLPPLSDGGLRPPTQQ